MDIFEKPMPVAEDNEISAAGKWTTEDLRGQFFAQVKHYPNLMFLFLTKRPSNINKYIPEEWKENPPLNVMFGCSPVNQETYNKMVPELLKVKGRRFLSIEPQLGEIAPFFPKVYPGLPKFEGENKPIDWIICGGESGAGRRPFDPEWARVIRDQCSAMGVPFFMKQIDKIISIPEDLMIREFPLMPGEWYFKQQMETLMSMKKPPGDLINLNNL